MNSDFDSIVADFHQHKIRDANTRLQSGVTDNLGELPNPSLAWGEAQRASAAALLSRFEALDVAGLEFDSRLDTELAMLMLRGEIHNGRYRFNGRTMAQQMPKAGDAIGDGIFQLFINDPRPAAERLDDIAARLEAVPLFLEQMLATLNTPVARWVTMELQVIEGLSQLFATVESWAVATEYPGIERLQSGRTTAETAILGYTSKLRDMPTTDNIHVGEDIARRIVAHRGVDKSLEELHQIATDFLSETAETIETLRVRLIQKYGLASDCSSEDLHLFLNDKYRVELPNGALEDILDIYRGERDDILKFIRERDLFPVLDNQSMNIIRTPSFMAPSIPAGAMLPPPAFRGGIRTSMVYLTLSEELVAEHTQLSIPVMMIHEGIPGHHLQLATASTHPSVIRRHVEAMEHAEGWTTMLEDYMLNVGYQAELADEVRFCGKRDISRIGARVAIDLFFMTGDKTYLDVGVPCDTSSEDPFVAAGTLLQKVTGFVPARVQAELNWYSQERGYPLSYLCGNHMVWELKADLAVANPNVKGVDLDRMFHEIYLHSGNMPLTYLRKVFVHKGLL